MGDINPGTIEDIGGDDPEIALFLSHLTGFDPGQIGYVIIATQFDEKGNRVFANTPDLRQIVALMLSVQFMMTIPWLGGQELTPKPGE